MTPIGKSRLEKIAQVNANKNVKTFTNEEIETCLGDVIGNAVTEENTCKNQEKKQNKQEKMDKRECGNSRSNNSA